MQSIRSRLFIWLIRNRHLLKFKLKPEVVDDSFSVIGFREEVDRLTASMKLPKGVATEKLTIAGIEAEWIIPANAADGKLLMYIHGGGFISGSCVTHRMHVAKFALECGLKSLVFDYRLAPEHPFPAAPDDCVTIFEWLVNNGYRPEDIVVGGESAGATLTLSLLIALKQKGIDMPAAAFAISPVTDLRCLAGSFSYNAHKDIAPMGSWNMWTRLYIGENDPTHPVLSPQFADLHGLPPLHICVGTHEIHLDDCVNFARKANEHGVSVTLSQWSKMVHAFPILSPLFPEARKAMRQIGEFVSMHLRHAPL